ncbi:MAG: family N-acetyltransferase [Bacteroidetes bacterium]|jgi:ribosomal protein S18 acetylase RimI-like enzyme|nr:family N-acetyltransferase [Bacteroidota bacterium]
MIRPYEVSDKEELISIFNLNVPKYFDPKELQEFEDYLEVGKDTYMTIESENSIIGGVGYEIRKSDSSGRINWIFLHPQFSGTGYGKQAVEYCLTILKQDPIVKTLVVRTSQLAYKFFERLGYSLIRTEKDYWGKGLDLYLMEQVNN